jgi:hypothetical protein
MLLLFLKNFGLKIVMIWKLASLNLMKPISMEIGFY